LLERIINASSKEGDLVADFFCGSGTTLAVAEKLGRRWIGVDIGRYAIHTSRKRLIKVQHELHGANQKYRPFDVYNLGRYERQWWQRERLRDAEAEHRRIILYFYRAQPLEAPPHPLFHGRKDKAYVHVVEVDSILTAQRLEEVVKAAAAHKAQIVHVLAWEFEMGIQETERRLEEQYKVHITRKYIPREVMQSNMTPEIVQFYEPGEVKAEVIRHKDGSIDVRLVGFRPAMSELSEKEREAMQERLLKTPFDFIDFWAIDFDYSPEKPFEQHWESFRLGKDRKLKLESDRHWKYEGKNKPYWIGVKVIDVFGIETLEVLSYE